MSNPAEDIKHDKFWLTVGAITLVLITVILMVKRSEEDKYSPIQALENEQAAQMNIRVLSNQN